MRKNQIAYADDTQIYLALSLNDSIDSLPLETKMKNAYFDFKGSKQLKSDQTLVSVIMSK